jgi:Zn-finger nucleic acid-binding protein
VDAASCPNCREAFAQKAFDGLYGRALTIDVCAGCQGIWFDEGESLQLSPGSTIAMFRMINDPADAGRRPLSERLECPRCALRLSLVVDQQRTTRFQYHRCPRGHGRFITYFHFLRARNFVRSLTPREVADLRARIRQVSCSNCGAPVDLDRDVACPYCRAPISMLDPEQVRITLAELQKADERRQTPDPALPLTLLMERLESERLFAEAERIAGGRAGWGRTGPAGSNLVGAGLDLVLGWLP